MAGDRGETLRFTVSLLAKEYGKLLLTQHYVLFFIRQKFRSEIIIPLIFAPRIANRCKCPGGEIGRRTVFRWRRREVCWFESSPGHITAFLMRFFYALKVPSIKGIQNKLPDKLYRCQFPAYLLHPF